MSWVHVLVFFSGGTVLIFEILGTRLISPVFGMTIFVWSSVITVTLAALALGYAGGGALADKPRPERALYLLLGASSVWTLALPVLRMPVLLAAGGLGVQAGALVASAVLFAPPLMCLGAVGPLAMRLRMRDLSRAGREIGGISALSTLGSVIGALAAGFLLIPNMSATKLLWALAAGQVLMTAFAAWKSGLKPGKVSLRWQGSALIVLAAAWTLQLRPRPAAAGLLREGARSYYGEIKVIDRPQWGQRTLYIDGIPNTVVTLDTLDSTSDYITSFELLPFFRPEGKRALLMGLGGGSLVGRLRDHYGVTTDVVDIDPEVLRLAERWFAFKPSGTMTIEDARRFVERSENHWDFMVLDAFNGDQHPYHLFSLESLTAMRDRLSGDGILAINMIGYAVGPKAKLRRVVERTLGKIFPHVRVMAANTDLNPGESYVNLTFFASMSPLDFRKDPRTARKFVAEWFAATQRQWLAPVGKGWILTDDFNPVESLSAPTMVEIRRTLLAFNREIMAY